MKWVSKREREGVRSSISATDGYESHTHTQTDTHWRAMRVVSSRASASERMLAASTWHRLPSWMITGNKISASKVPQGERGRDRERERLSLVLVAINVGGPNDWLTQIWWTHTESSEWPSKWWKFTTKSAMTKTTIEPFVDWPSSHCNWTYIIIRNLPLSLSLDDLVVIWKTTAIFMEKV